MWFWMILSAVGVGIVAQVGKGHLGVLWAALTLVLEVGLAVLVVGSAFLHAPDLLGTWSGDAAVNLMVAGGGGLAMTLIVLTLPSRHGPEKPKDTRPCPHCAEVIKQAAHVCRHCGRDVESKAA